MEAIISTSVPHVPRNKGKLTGQNEIAEQTRESVENRIRIAGLSPSDFLFPGWIHTSLHLLTRQYARIVKRWIESIGLDDTAHGTHTMRRTKASLICRRKRIFGLYSACSAIGRCPATSRRSHAASLGSTSAM